MSKLFYVPIEPLEERYTKQWYDEFPKVFKKRGYDVEVIDGNPLSETVDVGTFLDINSTIAYKNSQMIKIATMFRLNQVPNGSIFFFGDAEFWGIESLRLMADMNGIKNIKIYAFLHAGSYTKGDAFEIATNYQKYSEIGWLMSFDKVFVGSDYHKNAFIKRRVIPYASQEDVKEISDKIIVSGNPLFPNAYEEFNIPKKKKIIISNRFDWEKRPNISMDFAIILKDKIPDLEIVVSTSRKQFKSNKKWLEDLALVLQKQKIITIKSNLSKYEYHKELAESKIMLSNSIEENFGYCIAESIHYNTYPVCSNSLSHPELCLYDMDLLYNDLDEVVDKVQHLLNETKDIRMYNNKYYNALDKIIDNF